MTEDTTTAVPLPGDPAEWRATLRGLLRFVDGEAPGREACREWLRDRTDASRAEATRVLEFLEGAGLLAFDGGAEPGDHGREYLDTHDETVLYGALAERVDGFAAVVGGLAIRPLSDVEMNDLLAAELGDGNASVGVDPYRGWLRALGYLEHDEGVNELTGRGRRVVGADGMRPAGTGAEATVPEAGPSEGTAGVSAVDDAGGSEVAGTLRRRHDDTCMLCGDRRRRGPEAGYAEVHFLMPPAAPHGGPETPANALVVCPNHRADLEHGTVRVDPRTLEVDHAYEPAVSGRRLRTVEGHDVGAQYLAYHNDVVAGSSEEG